MNGEADWLVNALLECLCYCRVVDMDVARGMVILRNPNNNDGNLRDFTFDAVYDWKSVKLLNVLNLFVCFT